MNGVFAVCPGSFDPVTTGHLDIISRASRMFERVTVLVMPNSAKNPSFSVEERMELLRRVTAPLDNVEVDHYDGLLAEYCRIHRATAIVKGLRALSDFEYEFQMALTNKKLNPEVDTVFLTTRAENMYLSSSMVKLIASLDGDISDFVPEEIYHDIKDRLSGRKS